MSSVDHSDGLNASSLPSRITYAIIGRTHRCPATRTIAKSDRNRCSAQATQRLNRAGLPERRMVGRRSRTRALRHAFIGESSNTQAARDPPKATKVVQHHKYSDVSVAVITRMLGAYHASAEQ